MADGRRRVPNEIWVYADSFLKGGKPLTRILARGTKRRCRLDDVPEPCARSSTGVNITTIPQMAGPALGRDSDDD